MKDEFQKYIIDLYQDIPSGVYEGLLSTFCFGVVLMLAFCGIKKGLKYSIGLLLTEYVFKPLLRGEGEVSDVIRKATIVYDGKLTEEFLYLKDFAEGK